MSRDVSRRAEFSDLAWLFTCNNLNRGILRQNFDEAALLWRAVQSSDGAILEIGRRHGGSTALLIEAAGDRRITSIDLAPEHNPLCDALFERVLQEQPDKLQLVVGDSRTPFGDGRTWGLMFIDGDHSYDGVKADVRAHWAELNLGAPAVFHDAVPNPGLSYANKLNHCEGVRIVCEELVTQGCAATVESAGSSLWLKKLAELPQGF